MKPFNLKEYLKDPSKKVMTRDERAVKIHCTNYDSRQPIIAQIEGHNYSKSFTIDGRDYISDRISPYDLFFAPEKYEGWVNIYLDTNTNSYSSGACIYKTKEEAEKNGKDYPRYLKTIKIEWED